VALDTNDTLVRALGRLRPRTERGFRFIGTDRSERFLSYADMEDEAKRRAAYLQALGMKKGERIALVLADGYEFVMSFLGASYAGLVPVPIFPRATFKAIDGYVDTVAHIVKAAGARVLLTAEGTKPFVEQVFGKDAGLESLLTVETSFAGDAPEFKSVDVTPDDLCFLQFTSGSTSTPKGVMVTHRNLVANAKSFLGPDGLRRTEDDVGVSWLPLYHDMGLIGFVLGTIICDIQAVLLPTSSFARTPRIWLDLIHKYKGTITYAPNFAYALVAKRVKPEDLAALDLSGLRVAGCGAEPIRGQTLLDFADKLAPAGFRGQEVFLPSYGMAESTLAITFHQLGTPILIDRVDADAMKRGKATPATDKSAVVLDLVSCGVPFPEHELEIVDDNGKPLGEREVGQLVSRGPSVTPGYFQNEEATADALRDGWLQTGDLAYRADGNVYICGRIKDLIIINGANHYPQDIEWAVGDIEGVRRGNVVAFSVMRDGTEQLVLVAEGNASEAPRLREEIARTVTEQFGLQVNAVAIVAVGSLPKTSSGKAQRRKSRAMYEEKSFVEHP